MANGDSPQQFTTQEFAAKIKTKYPAYANIPDEQLVQKITAKYPQYKAQIKQQTAAPTGTPINKAAQGTISAQPSFGSFGSRMMAALKRGPVEAGQELGSSMIRPLEQSTAKVPGINKTIGEATTGAQDWAKLALITLGLTGGEGFLPGAASKAGLISKVEPTQQINKILGVVQRELIPGKMPASLDEFAVNPGRGVLKAGINPKSLQKASPLERNTMVMKAKDAAGKVLGDVLDTATKSGKTVDVYDPIKKVFAKLDAEEIKKTTDTLMTIFQKHGINPNGLDKLSPSLANLLKQSLWDEGGQIANQLRRGIAESLKTAVPEAKDALRDFGDLAGASKATQRGAQKFAKEAPQSELRKYIMKYIVPRAIEGAGIGGAWKLYDTLFGGKKK